MHLAPAAAAVVVAIIRVIGVIGGVRFRLVFLCLSGQVWCESPKHYTLSIRACILSCSCVLAYRSRKVITRNLTIAIIPGNWWCSHNLNSWLLHSNCRSFRPCTSGRGFALWVIVQMWYESLTLYLLVRTFCRACQLTWTSVEVTDAPASSSDNCTWLYM